MATEHTSLLEDRREQYKEYKKHTDTLVEKLKGNVNQIEKIEKNLDSQYVVLSIRDQLTLQQIELENELAKAKEELKRYVQDYVTFLEQTGAYLDQEAKKSHEVLLHIHNAKTIEALFESPRIQHNLKRIKERTAKAPQVTDLFSNKRTFLKEEEKRCAEFHEKLIDAQDGHQDCQGIVSSAKNWIDAKELEKIEKSLKAVSEKIQELQGEYASLALKEKIYVTETEYLDLEHQYKTLRAQVEQSYAFYSKAHSSEVGKEVTPAEVPPIELPKKLQAKKDHLKELQKTCAKKKAFLTAKDNCHFEEFTAKVQTLKNDVLYQELNKKRAGLHIDIGSKWLDSLLKARIPDLKAKHDKQKRNTQEETRKLEKKIKAETKSVLESEIGYCVEVLWKSTVPILPQHVHKVRGYIATLITHLDTTFDTKPSPKLQKRLEAIDTYISISVPAPAPRPPVPEGKKTSSSPKVRIPPPPVVEKNLEPAEDAGPEVSKQSRPTPRPRPGHFGTEQPPSSNVQTDRQPPKPMPRKAQNVV